MEGIVLINVEYDENIRNMILANLDGWRIADNAETDETDESISPYMTVDEAIEKANKTITNDECQLFYEEALDLAYSYTNRLNIDDLSDVSGRIFLRAVCKWTASNLWNKYNVRVNNEDMEDTYIQSYGGLLYKSAMNTLRQFINQRISNLTDNNNDDDVWIVL